MMKLKSFCFDNNGWVIGDWLINYTDGGFKRRGLSGNFFFFLQDITNLRLNLLIFIVVSLLYILFFLALISVILKKNPHNFLYLLILSPLTFLFFFNDNLIIGRKEVIIFLLFTYFVKTLSENSYSRTKEFTFVCCILVATLFHEMMFFYVPYFLFALYLFNKKFDWKSNLKYLIASIIPVLFILIFGKHINEGNTFTILSNRGTELRDKIGILTWSEKMDVVEYLKVNWNLYYSYLIIFAWCLFIFILYIYSLHREIAFKIVLFFLSAIMFSLPLFILAIDWGRWLQIHFTILTILLLFIQQDQMRPNIYESTKNVISLPLLFVALTININLIVQHCDKGLSIRQYKFNTLKKIFSIKK